MPLPSICVVRDGVRFHTDELFATAPWWVVYVRCEGEHLGCVYGGRSGSVRHCISQHKEWGGDVALLVAYPFESGRDSLESRPAIENYHTENSSVEDHRRFCDC